MLKKIWQWIVYSSADPKALSLTVKGVLTLLIPVIVILTRMFDTQVDSTKLEIVVEDIAQIVFYISGAIGLILTAVGLSRKITTTLEGQNKVMLGFKKKK